MKLATIALYVSFSCTILFSCILVCSLIGFYLFENDSHKQDTCESLFNFSIPALMVSIMVVGISAIAMGLCWLFIVLNTL